ncbi:hypothetical protein [Tenacibaculum agarivorans]|uniref:hypothetical protein n=1 Tax=Tenacibaculum agarivorans TaxID=1908389 RepID=UPI00094B7FD9|nr:hypothetical protein [Tenacibaculum agarivorans]
MLTGQNIFRKPNEIEQKVIDICKKNTRYFYREIFFIFLILTIIIWFLTVLAFSKQLLPGFIFMVIAFMLTFLVKRILKAVKQCNVNCSHLIYSDEDEWKIELKNSSSRHPQYISKVGDKLIIMIVPGMFDPPNNGSSKYIAFEYVQLFDSPPVFGNNFIFTSIEGNNLNHKDLYYMENITPPSITSIFIVCIFAVLLLIYFISGFTFTFCAYVCLALLYPVVRIIKAWLKNKKLRKDVLNRNVIAKKYNE